MSAGGALPWFKLRGAEVANVARTMAYMRSGIAAPSSGTFEVAAAYPCGVLYREGGGVDESRFSTPAADPAPWYAASFPESAAFLGLIVTGIDGLDSVVARAPSARLGGIEGVTLGPEHAGGRTLTFRALLVAAHPSAGEYGMRWLTDVLAAECSNCAKAELQVYASCPPDDASDDSRGLYTLYDVGLTTGPKFVGNTIPGESCDLREVEWTMVAENPYLYHAPVTCLEPEVVGATAACADPYVFFLGTAGTPHCCDVEPPAIGTLGTIITIDSPDGIGGIELGYFSPNDPTAPPGGDPATCPPAGGHLPYKQIYVEKLRQGETLVIDSARRRVTLTDAAGTESDGTSALYFPPGQVIEWLEIASCDPEGCICARTTSPCSLGAATTVEIKTQLRVK